MIGLRRGKMLIRCGVLAYLLVMLLPAAAFLLRVLSSPSTSSVDGGTWAFPFPSTRQWGLLFKTLGLSASAAVAALFLSLPGAFAIGRIGKISNTPLLTGLIVLPLMLPPMIFAFGWQRLLGGYAHRHWSPLLRCIWVWASWSWPIPAIILGSGWSRTGRSAYEAALLATSGGSAFVRAVVPVLWRHVLISGLILFVLFVGEYSVPHANGVFVIASDLIETALYSNVRHVFVEMFGVLIPLLAVILGVVFLVRRLWSGTLVSTAELGRMDTTGRSPAVIAMVLGVLIVTMVLPVIKIVWREGLGGELVLAWNTYRYEILSTLAICAAVGMMVTLIGIAVVAGTGVTKSRLRSLALVTTLVAGIVPGAVVGQAVLAAYQPVGWLYSWRPVGMLGWLIYNNWPIVVIGLSARFAWIGVLTAWLIIKTTPRCLIEQSWTDGADRGATGLFLQLRQQWPTLLCGAFLAGSLSMADIAVVCIVRVTSPTKISLIIIEKIHRFESGMLASLSLWLVASVVPGAILMMIVLRRRN